jgi:hypothetical protein
MLDIKQAIEAGDIVGMMADRARSDERAVVVRFLGSDARFPAGPWIVASMLDVPVSSLCTTASVITNAGWSSLHGWAAREAREEALRARPTLCRVWKNGSRFTMQLVQFLRILARKTSTQCSPA